MMDLTEQFYFWKSFLVENIKQGTIPFWNPYSFSGTPFLAHPATAAFYPLNIIFFLFPLSPAFIVYIFMHVVLAWVFMYLLAKKFTDKLGAVAAGTVFALSGMMAARIYSGHIDIISTLIWIPVVFGSIITTLENKKRADFIKSIFFLTLQILAGYQAVVIFTLELIFIYQVVLALLDHKKALLKLVIFILIAAISFGLSAIQWLPTVEFVRNSIRGQGLPYEMLTWGSYTFDQFAMFVNPFRYGNPFPENYTYVGPGPNFFEISYFVGKIPLLLFIGFIAYQLLLFVAKRKVNKVIIGLFIPLLFFLLAAMGNNAPLHKLLYVMVPPYRLFRFPSQHLILVVFIISLLVGFSLRMIKSISLKLVILLLITVELLNYDSKFIKWPAVPTDTFDHNLISILQKDKELVRVLPDYSVVSQVRKAWDFESSMYYKIYSTSGYNPLLLANYYHYIDLLNKNYSSSIRQYNVEIPPPDPSSEEIGFLNVKYVLTDKNHDIVHEKSLARYTLKTEGATYRLYENKNYLPRFFTDCLDKDDIEVADYKINYIKLKTNSTCDGNLSSSEVYYPGWRASIDSKETPIIKSNTAFRSIILPKGEHEVVFYYQPTIYLIGGLITLISLATLFLLLKYNSKPNKITL